MRKAPIFLMSCFLFCVFVKKMNGQNISMLQRAVIEKEVDSAFHFQVIAAEKLDYDMLSNAVDDRYKWFNGLQFTSLCAFIR